MFLRTEWCGEQIKTWLDAGAQLTDPMIHPCNTLLHSHTEPGNTSHLTIHYSEAAGPGYSCQQIIHLDKNSGLQESEWCEGSN